MTQIYELRIKYYIPNFKEIICAISPSKELVLQVAIDGYNLTKVNNYYLIENKEYIQLDFINENKGPYKIDMIEYQANQKERVGKIE